MTQTAKIALKDITFDAGTQIRAAISQEIVAEYAECMSEGVTFPPVVLFHDGNQYYMADGFHRGLASQRVGYVDIDATVQAGTKTDALWYALGANRANAHRMTPVDKKHAVLLALITWPDVSMKEISRQAGCAFSYVHRLKQGIPSDTLPARVTGKDGRSYPASRSHQNEAREKTCAEIARRVLAGQSSSVIQRDLSVRGELIAQVRREVGHGSLDTSKGAIRERHDRMRELAASQHSSRQIAKAVGLTDKTCRNILRKEGIDVPADRAMGNTKRLDSNRIVGHIVMDAENLTADVGLIDLDSLDRARLGEWLSSLKASRDKLMAFIRCLMKEQQKHEAA